MDDIPIRNHEKRSKFYERISWVTIVSVFTLAVAVVIFLPMNSMNKTVTLLVDGKVKTIHTKQIDVKGLLSEQSIQIGKNDRVSEPMDAQIKNGERITILPTQSVSITADGQTKTLRTVGKTVGGALKDLNITLGPNDKVSPALDAAVDWNDTIKIIRVKKNVEEVTEPIAFQTVEKKDASLTKGKEKILQQGKDGVLLKKEEKIYEDGMLVATNVIDQTTQTNSVDKIVAIGTKSSVVTLSATSPAVEKVMKDGVTFSVKKVLHQVILTGYSADFASTGKNPGDKEYGVTYTGTHVVQGQTIAVDPRVIPLGWWVYIEGYGFRHAEDIGSGVKGKWIDIYYDSESNAEKFGLKRGNTVYVIGPHKPDITVKQ